MEIKLFEVRDISTFMPMMAIKLSSRNESERYLLARSGYGRTLEEQNTYIMLIRIYGDTLIGSSDIYGHGQARTLQVAHDYIYKNWGSLNSGSVVCVETILGERSMPKESERYEQSSTGV